MHYVCPRIAHAFVCDGCTMNVRWLYDERAMITRVAFTIQQGDYLKYTYNTIILSAEKNKEKKLSAMI